MTKQSKHRGLAVRRVLGACLLACGLAWVLALASLAAPQAVRYTYDAANRLVTVVYDKTGAIDYEYDESGNRTRKTVMGPAQPNADYNGDGIADLWAYVYFGFAGVSPTNDPDGDGLDNAQEAVCWTDPMDADSVLGLVGAATGSDSSSNRWYVLRWPSAAYAVYGIDRATNLMDDGAWVSLTNSLKAAPPMNTYTDRYSGAGAVYYRVRAQ